MSAFVRRQYGVLKSFLLGVFLALMALTSVSFGLTEMDDSSMQDVNGAGLAFAFDDFRFQMEPTSYFGNMGTVPSVASRTRPNGSGIWPAGSSGNTAYKGDYQWIGTTISRGYQVDSTGIAIGAAGYKWDRLYNFSDFVTGTGGTFLSVPTTSATAAAANPTVYTDMFGQKQSLAYPIAAGGAQGYAEINNPFVMRVYSYNAVGLNGAAVWAPGVTSTVLELVGATHSTPFRWAFWGQVNAFKDDGTTPLVAAVAAPGNDPYGNAGYPSGTTSAPFSTLENQEIIIGSPTSRFRPDGTNPAGDGTGIEIGCTGTGTGTTGCGNAQYQIMGPVFRLYQSMGSTNTGSGGVAVAGGNNDQTLGMMYMHRLSGDYRFSVNEPGYKTAAGGWRIPTFDAQEGMYFMGVNAYLPVGQLHYQSLILSAVKGGGGVYTGDFITETSLLPNDPAAYNDFYGYPKGWSGFTGLDNVPTAAQLATIDYGFKRQVGTTGHMSDRYYETHGYVRWGDNFPTNAEVVPMTRLANASNWTYGYWSGTGGTGAGTAASQAAGMTNTLAGSGVTNTKGWSGAGVQATNGTTCGGTSSQQCVTYHIKPYAINKNNFLDVYVPANWPLNPEINSGFCGTGRDKTCGGGMGGTTPEVTGTVPVNVTANSASGQGTQAELLSAGGMVFLARNGGSWTVPINPNLASSTASESTNTLIFGNSNAKRVLTSVTFSDASCTASGWAGSTCAPGVPNANNGILGSATGSGGTGYAAATCTPGSPSVHPVCTRLVNRPTVTNIRAGYTDANGTALTGLDATAKSVMNVAGATANLSVTGVNLGSSRVEGMLIQHLNVTTLGAAN